MIWVFGYGSLMWRPGFEYAERRPATLRGYRRAFCRYSLRHRGTEESPGLVVGLVAGESCRGYAFRLAEEKRREVLEYLDDREGAGYFRRCLPLEVERNGKCSVEEAWVYLPDEAHRTHIKAIEPERMVRLIATGRGKSGTAHDYLIALIGVLEGLGRPDPELIEVLRAVERFKRGGSGKGPGASPSGPAARAVNGVPQ
ncbi:MAG: gamma-glutamylcyclotransferase [bacterium]